MENNQHKKYKDPENVEGFYQKSKTQEELTERIKILKEIPEDKSIPKVIVKLGSPKEKHKFDLMTDEEGRIYFIALPMERKEYHSDIYKFSQKLYKRKLNVIGGGYIFGDVNANTILISGESINYGFVPKWKVKEILEKKFPKIKVEVDSVNGDLIRDPEKVLASSLESKFALASKEVLEEIFKNKELVKELVKENPYILKYALFTNQEENIFNDKEIIEIALKADKKGEIVNFFPKQFKD